MPATAETIVDLTVLHQIGLQRFSRTVVRRILSTLRQMQTDIEAQIRERLPTGENGEPDPASFRLATLLQQVRLTQEEAHRVIRGNLDADLDGVIQTEAEFAARLSRIAIGTDARLATVSAEQLRAAVMSRPMQGKALRDWTARLEAGDVDRIRSQITMGYLEGESVPQVVRRVRQAGTVTARGAETLTRTTMTHINARAVAENAKANPGLFPGYQWVSVLDNRTTPVCRTRAGKSYKNGSGPLPPAHPNCLPGDSLVTPCGEITNGYKRWFEGELVFIKTASGRELAVTPNHPVFVDGGWVAAGEVKVGGNVICRPVRDGVASAIDVDNQDLPTRIDDLVEAVFASGKVTATVMPTAAPHFHGDGMDGDVAIVGAKRLLGGREDASVVQDLEKIDLVLRGVDETGAYLFDGSSFCNQALPRGPATSGCLVGSQSEQLAIFDTRSGHPSELLLRPIPDRNAGLLESSQDDVGGDPCQFGNRADTDPICVKADSFIEVDRPLAATKFDAALDQAVSNGSHADVQFVSDVLGASAAGVFSDQVVNVDRQPFCGHVFNLETETGVFFAQGVLTHNCRSTIYNLVQGVPPADDIGYERWLDRQDAATQRDILGPARYDLWKKGGVRIDRFTDGNRALTLDQLRARDAEAFRKAGL